MISGTEDLVAHPIDQPMAPVVDDLGELKHQYLVYCCGWEWESTLDFLFKLTCTLLWSSGFKTVGRFPPNCLRNLTQELNQVHKTSLCKFLSSCRTIQTWNWKYFWIKLQVFLWHSSWQDSGVFQRVPALEKGYKTQLRYNQIRLSDTVHSYYKYIQHFQRCSSSDMIQINVHHSPSIWGVWISTLSLDVPLQIPTANKKKKKKTSDQHEQYHIRVDQYSWCCQVSFLPPTLAQHPGWSAPPRWQIPSG